MITVHFRALIGKLSIVLRIKSGLVLIIIAALISACLAQPAEQFVLGDVLLEEGFDQSFVWENYNDPALGVNFRVEDGVYHAQAGSSGFMWALNSEAHTDVVIQVDTQQISSYANNAYGLMCRAAPTNNGDGYYFMISGDGMYTLRRGATDQVGALIEWTYSDAIQQGQSINRIRAVCIGDYLALYVNGRFVAETHDSYFSRGYAGLTAAVPEGGDVDVTFDELKIWSATIVES